MKANKQKKTSNRNDPISFENAAVRDLVERGKRVAVKAMEDKRIVFPSPVDEQTAWFVPGIGTFPLEMEKRAQRSRK